jgi:hypothetical protein
MATDSTHSPTSPSTHSAIDQHPDIVGLRARYAEVSDKPFAGMIEGLCLLTGLWLAISPWVVGFDNIASLRVSNLVVGLALAVLAMGYGSVLERTHGLGWVAVAIGIWTIIAPWVVTGNANTHDTIWNNCFTGGAACLLGLLTMGLGFMRRRAR